MNKDQTSASIVVEVRGVHKTYPRGSETLDVLQGVDVEVERGEFLALMGPSGSGKTTLLNLIAGIDSPTSGRVIVNGRESSSSDEDRLARWRRNQSALTRDFSMAGYSNEFAGVSRLSVERPAAECLATNSRANHIGPQTSVKDLRVLGSKIALLPFDHAG
jgi:ABC-type phosphate/phosphonate transport system ATPase subunit